MDVVSKKIIIVNQLFTTCFVDSLDDKLYFMYIAALPLLLSVTLFLNIWPELDTSEEASGFFLFIVLFVITVILFSIFVATTLLTAFNTINFFAYTLICVTALPPVVIVTSFILYMIDRLNLSASIAKILLYRQLILDYTFSSNKSNEWKALDSLYRIEGIIPIAWNGQHEQTVAILARQEGIIDILYKNNVEVVKAIKEKDHALQSTLIKQIAQLEREIAILRSQTDRKFGILDRALLGRFTEIKEFCRPEVPGTMIDT